MHTLSFTLMHTHAHSFTLMHTHSHSFTLTHSHSFTLVHTHSHSFTLIHTRSRSFTPIHTRSVGEIQVTLLGVFVCINAGEVAARSSGQGTHARRRNPQREQHELPRRPGDRGAPDLFGEEATRRGQERPSSGQGAGDHRGEDLVGQHGR